MIAGPYRTGARSAEERARNLAALNAVAYEVAVIRARGGAVYRDVAELPNASAA